MQFCKGVKIFNFSSEISFGQLLLTFGIFLQFDITYAKLLLILIKIARLTVKNLEPTILHLMQIGIKKTKILCFKFLLSQ